MYQIEKGLGEQGGDVDPAVRTSVEDALRDAKAVLDSNDAGKLRSALERLTAAQHKLAEAMYAKAARSGGGEAGAGPGAQQGGPGDGQTGGRPGGRDDVVDADFEEVKE